MNALFQRFFSLLALLLVISACGNDEEIPQNPQPKPQPPTPKTLEVTPLTIEAPIEGLEQEVTIRTTAESWEITLPETQDWVQASITQGQTGESTTTIRVEKNPGNTRRSATLTVSAPECPNVKISITQLSSTEELFYGGKLYIEPDISEMGEKTARELVADLGLAWNLGNSLEIPSGETEGGNVMTTQQVIAFVKSCGFKTIRIPISWLAHEDGRYDNYHIHNSWFRRVAEVIDYCLAIDLYVVINEHWDSDAFNNLSVAAREEQLRKAEVLWRQIAIRFRDYDHRLLFAGFNENLHNTTQFGGPNENSDYFESHNLLVERFVKTVRETGGRNSYRYLVIPGYNAEINQTVEHLRLPEDPTQDRLLVECHFHTPWAFCGQEEFADWIIYEEYMYLWDHFLPSKCNSSYYKLAQMEQELQQFGSWCHSHHVGALLGEFAAGYHGDLATLKKSFRLHQESRAWWHYNVARLCKEQVICPMLWDNGDVDPTSTTCRGGYLDRRNFLVVEPAMLYALQDGYQGRPFVYRTE